MFRITARWAAYFQIAFGIVVSVGWHFRIPVLKGSAFGTFVSPNAALLAVFSGVALLLYLHGGRFAKRCSLALGSLIALFALVTVLDWILDLNLAMHRFYMSHRMADWTVPGRAGRFAFPTSVAFAAAGLTLLGLNLQRWRFAEIGAAVVGAISYLSVIGYLYGTQALYGYIMALHTAVLMAAMAIGLYAALEERSLAANLMTDYAGGLIARRVLFVLILGLPAIGYMALRLKDAWQSNDAMLAAVIVIGSLLVSGFAVLHTAALLSKADRANRNAQAALIRAERLSVAGRMAATVAHEINNPLSAVMNLVYLLRSGPRQDRESQELLVAAEHELQRVAAITRQTLGFYRDSEQPRTVSIKQVVDDVLRLFGPKLSGVEVVNECADDAEALARPGEIRQVVLNLLTNSLDALGTGGGGRIVIRSSREGAQVRLTVADNGPGVPEHLRQEVFEPFFTTKKDVGTGLGLYVSRRLIENNGGALVLDGAEGIETVFVVTLPASHGRHSHHA